MAYISLGTLYLEECLVNIHFYIIHAYVCMHTYMQIDLSPTNHQVNTKNAHFFFSTSVSLFLGWLLTN